jgi:allene oxide cyclase
MRGTRTTFIAAAVLAAFAIVVSLGPVSAAGPNVTRIHVIEHATTDTLVDLTANGDSTGDLLTFHNTVFDAANVDAVASSHGDCIRIEVGVSWECRWVTTFDDGGSITVEGPFLDAGPSVLAITGGTGIYRSARGSMRLVARDAGGTEYDFVFRVLTV